MHKDHLKDQFHKALHRGAAEQKSLTKLTEEQFEELTVVMLAAFAEALAEVAVVLADVATRVEALEGGQAG